MIKKLELISAFKIYPLAVGLQWPETTYQGPGVRGGPCKITLFSWCLFFKNKQRPDFKTAEKRSQKFTLVGNW
ncbi:hypothetical protein X474_19070 [Dethiosulfatarculus sandiegensis]|uniref:Uncharacterized protein n=1 Tax=Dethiosulfatarculus sandiegensis TaxID=1429043 RepID=A0A0D2JSG5_9BACT|nr:hypothetical protein X474_19070 [Dethiosulfatarculus sandiegensis]